jgi:type I restriction enzyme, S subunit
VEITEDEIPFDIPESWKWVRLGDCTGYSQTKPKISPKDITDDMWSLDLEDIQKESGAILTRTTASERKITGDKVLFYKGQVLYSKLRPYLKKILIAPDNGICTPELVPFNTYLVYANYIVYVLRSPHIDYVVNSVTYGVKMPRVGTETMVNLLIPLPPLSEQKRIVAKIEELLPLIGRYAVAYEKLEQFNAKFPEDMKKSILQYAIQGKLVEQRTEEGTGEELYQQIQTEKQHLIAEKKIKKEKPLAAISEDEIPFDIPESWKWVRLSQIATLENGDRSSKYPVEKDYVNFGIPFFGAKDMSESTMSFDNVRYISESKFSELRNGKLQDKDFICLLRGSVGKCAIFTADDKHRTGFICAQMVIIRCVDSSVSEYLHKFLLSPFYLQYIESKITGTAVRQLPAKELANVLIPLPPIAEQKRIVAKIEELLPLCERLK